MFTLLALLISLIVSLVTPEYVFTIPHIKTEIRKNVDNKDIQKELIELVNIAGDDIRAFNEFIEKKNKVAKELYGHQNANRAELELILSNSLDERKKHQSRIIDYRIQMQNLLSDDEWKKIIDVVSEPTIKGNKKNEKELSKVLKAEDKYIDKFSLVIEKVIETNVQKDTILSALTQFTTDLRLHLNKGRELNYKSNEVINSRSATKLAFEQFYTEQNIIRDELYQSLINLHQTASKYTSADEWKRFGKSIQMIFNN